MRLHRNLTAQVLLAISLGIALGLLAPDVARRMKPVGDTFVNLVKMIITPIIFLTIVAGIANVRDIKQVARSMTIVARLRCSHGSGRTAGNKEPAVTQKRHTELVSVCRSRNPCPHSEVTCHPERSEGPRSGGMSV